MCCRFLLKQQHYRDMLTRLGIAAPADFVSRYNIAPGTDIPVVRRKPGKIASHEATRLHWGLVPSWAKDADGPPLVNARAESLAEKPSFRDALRSRRCIIPASGFYEWEVLGRARKPWLFTRRDEQPFGLAGLWETWTEPGGPVLESCAVITTAPNSLMEPIHHRMPVMLAPDDFPRWLDATPNEAAALLVTPPSADLSAMAVSARVSQVRNDDPACIEPWRDAADDEPQLSLGF